MKVQPKLNFRIHSCYAEIEFTLSKKKFLVFELSEMNLFHSFSADVYFVKNKSQFQLTEKLMDFHILCTLEKNDSEDYTKSFALEIKRYSLFLILYFYTLTQKISKSKVHGSLHFRVMF
ncbi:hypothetical protein HMI56_003601 [Coelomomyces lativittatus]|nr:hypothetical protein HMI56_003601 [Coelomomyces lativittatus]